MMVVKWRRTTLYQRIRSLRCNSKFLKREAKERQRRGKEEAKRGRGEAKRGRGEAKERQRLVDDKFIFFVWNLILETSKTTRQP